MRNLQTLLNPIPFDDLPPAWTTFDLARFSRAKKLWDYQQTALQNALKALWKFYSEPHAEERKRAFFQWYADNHITLDDITLGKKRDNAALLAPYYPITDAQIPYEHFINRIGFWMATGSGKTLVIVKLIELLWTLMQRGEIPTNDVLVLTHREDLLQQLRAHVNEYNAAGGALFIRLRELKEYAEVKREFPSLLGHQEITVFYYRSDNLSDEQKERIIDFRNYDNNGRWYVLLDEAHKGDKDDSKRQHIYSILSRHGFLFNFSATFTDARDKLTTAAEFNLASFIEAGYGKHIAILKQENRAFRRDEDFTDEEKQKIVLQALLMLTYVSQSRERLNAATNANLYHRPLLIALVNSVNTEDADLKLFFAQLERIARGTLRVSDAAFRRAKNDLWAELDAHPEWLYEDAPFTPDASIFNALTLNDVLKHVFNAPSPGEIEVLARPSNDKELAFKLKSASAPFALIKIGDTRAWRKEMLAGYTFVEGFSDESFFECINADDTDITLLMGSRSFYEGWDSNRPNVITFINIGTGADAKKFVLQSVGRGVRIEPLKNKRRRLENLRDLREVDEQTFGLAQPFLNAVQTLFLFGTNRAVLDGVLRELGEEKEKPEGVELALEVNPLAHERVLLVPTYKPADHPLIEDRDPRKFELAASELDTLDAYVRYLGDDRLLLAHHDLTPQKIGYLHRTLAARDTFFNTQSDKRFGSVSVLLPRLARYFDMVPREWESVKPLDVEIEHYRHIRVVLQNIEELRRKIQAVQAYRDPEVRKRELREQYEQGKLGLEALMAETEKLGRASAEEIFAPPNQPPLKIKNVAAHYYLPLLLSDDEKIDYISHVIRIPSEVRFIEQLEAYLKEQGNLFASAFDWWMFSRTDETLDRVFIPYYDPAQNRMREFHPDFIFWLKRFNDYFILFVDPKGMSHTAHQHKIEGYREIFTDRATNALRVFNYNGMNVRVALALVANDANQAPREYQDFWFDQPKGILKQLVIGQGDSI